MIITIAPTGKLIEGHVLDCRKEGVERALKHYDPLLYVKWNPRKLGKFGCWEVRRKPEHKTVVEFHMVPGLGVIAEMDYKELDVVNHVLDVPFLNYRCVERIKEMDVWVTTNWIDKFESKESSAKEKEKERVKSDLGYRLRYNRSMARDLRQAALEGQNLAQLARYWGK